MERLEQVRLSRRLAFQEPGDERLRMDVSLQAQVQSNVAI